MDAWRALAEPLERAFGWKLCAWDPGYMFEVPEKYTIELGTNEVRAIGALIERCAAAECETDRWRHGVPIEGDHVCPDSLALDDARTRLAKLEQVAEAARTLVASGYDGPFMGDEVAPLLRAVAELECEP